MSKLLILTWPFWWPAPIQEGSRAHPERLIGGTKDTRITQEIKRTLGTLSQEPGSKTKTLKQKALLAFYLQGMQELS